MLAQRYGILIPDRIMETHLSTVLQHLLLGYRLGT